jgi:hypothetical protein
MSTDPLARLPSAFGRLLVRLRRERKWDVEALAKASGLAAQEVQSFEAEAPPSGDVFPMSTHG